MSATATAPAASADDPATRPVVRLRPGQHRRVREGHPWVFSNEIEMTAAAKALAPGTPVTLESAGGEALGVASFNPHPLISARLLDRDPSAVIDRDLIARRLAAALALRTRMFAAPFYRLVHAEADALPGLVVDRYGDIAVVQCNTAGMERLEGAILDALGAVIGPGAVVLRNDGIGRRLEGLSEEVRLARGALDGPVTIEENGARFFADPLGGQKTGWFFDHRANRALVARFAEGARVLDLYSYLGGFAIPAALAGAAEVVAVDRSAPALALAERAASANGVAAICRFVRGDIFAELERRAASGERFDLVIADPPAFVKAKKDLKPGIKGYRKLARRAAALVRPGGFLFLASCSHHVDAALFALQLQAALRDLRRSGRILYAGGAGPDHPVHPFLPETGYLKALLLQLD